MENLSTRLTLLIIFLYLRYLPGILWNDMRSRLKKMTSF